MFWFCVFFFHSPTLHRSCNIFNFMLTGAPPYKLGVRFYCFAPHPECAGAEPTKNMISTTIKAYESECKAGADTASSRPTEYVRGLWNGTAESQWHEMWYHTCYLCGLQGNFSVFPPSTENAMWRHKTAARVGPPWTEKKPLRTPAALLKTFNFTLCVASQLPLLFQIPFETFYLPRLVYTKPTFHDNELWGWLLFQIHFWP